MSAPDKPRPRSTPGHKPRPGGPRRPGSVAPRAGKGPPDDGLERLQKVLAAAGLGSRRACEELVTSGRVEVDRVVVTTLGTKVDPRNQEIRVDGERLPDPRRVVFLLHKPVGTVTTNYDPSGRPRVVDLVPDDRRLFAVGRLDRMSEGLILLTNDGDLANLLAHPRYGVEKKYLVQVAGVPTPDLLERLRQGVRLAEGEVHAKRLTVRSQHKQSAVLEMVLDEGKNREIRRMLAKLGHKVHQLKRIAVGGLSLGNLLPGQWRQLSATEVESLRRDALAEVGDEAAHGERPQRRRPDGGRSPGRSMGRGRAGGDRPGGGRPGGGRPAGPKPAGRPAGAKPTGRPSGAKPAGRPTGHTTRRKRAGKASSWRSAKRGKE